MISGLPPFYSTDRQVLFSNIREQELKFTRHHNTVTRDLLARLLVKDPAERLWKYIERYELKNVFNTDIVVPDKQIFKIKVNDIY